MYYGQQNFKQDQLCSLYVFDKMADQHVNPNWAGLLNFAWLRRGAESYWIRKSHEIWDLQTHFLWRNGRLKKVRPIGLTYENQYVYTLLLYLHMRLWFDLSLRIVTRTCSRLWKYFDQQKIFALLCVNTGYKWKSYIDCKFSINIW